MGQASRVFNPIPRSPERDSILSEVASTQSEVLVKISNQQTLVTKAMKWVSPFKLQLTYPEGLRPVVQRAVPIQFKYRDDIYFAMAFVQDTGTQFVLVIEEAIYKVQRRQSFRLKLPANYPMGAEVFELNHHSVKDAIRVLDLSEGGCSVLVPGRLQVTMGSYLGLKVKIGNRPAFIQYGRVRYLKAEKTELRLGIEFDKDRQMNADLFNLTRDLYVELFSRWARRR